MKYLPDHYLLWEDGFITFNMTIVYTWIVMAVLVLLALIVRIKLTHKENLTKTQNILEVVVLGIEKQIKEVTGKDYDITGIMPYIGTLFLFIMFSNLISIIPGFMSPTSSLSTTVALASLSFLSAIYFGIKKHGIVKYLKHYLYPMPIMLPLNIISEISGTISLAIRLYGNIMSGAVIGMVSLMVIPLFFPIAMQLLGIITGVVQAYIFSVLTLVYIVNADIE